MRSVRGLYFRERISVSSLLFHSSLNFSLAEERAATAEGRGCSRRLPLTAAVGLRGGLSEFG
jgi:hypothetical protein